MARKPEATFRLGVEKYLPKGVYVQGNTTPFSSGTPDRYYEWSAGAFWVEYKYIPHVPSIITPALTELQRQWLNRARANHVRVAVIIGCPDGGVLLEDGIWNYSLDRESFMSRVQCRRALAEEIARRIQ
jgi:hypothetical protein